MGLEGGAVLHLDEHLPGVGAQTYVDGADPVHDGVRQQPLVVSTASSTSVRGTDLSVRWRATR